MCFAVYAAFCPGTFLAGEGIHQISRFNLEQQSLAGEGSELFGPLWLSQSRGPFSRNSYMARREQQPVLAKVEDVHKGCQWTFWGILTLCTAPTPCVTQQVVRTERTWGRPWPCFGPHH